MPGAVLALYVAIPNRMLAGILAFAAGSLIAAPASDIAFEGANHLVQHRSDVRSARHKGRSAVVLPVVGGLLLALYLALVESTT